jgi:hypothetical protein
MTPNIAPGDFGRVRPKPLDIMLSGLLDAVTGISGYLPALPPYLRDEHLEAHAARLELVAAVLKRLRCIRCGLVDTIRYLPRILMPIDLDLSPEAHAARAKRRTLRLHRAREFVTQRPELSSVLWIPPMHDPEELLESSKDLFTLLDTAGGKPLNEVDTYWRVAIWAQMAITRKHQGKVGAHWVGLLPKIETAIRSNAGTPWPMVEARLRELPGHVAGLGRVDDAEQRALKILDVLMTPKFEKARDVLRRYCEIHVYPPAQKHHRRTRPPR